MLQGPLSPVGSLQSQHQPNNDNQETVQRPVKWSSAPAREIRSLGRPTSRHRFRADTSVEVPRVSCLNSSLRTERRNTRLGHPISSRVQSPAEHSLLIPNGEDFSNPLVAVHPLAQPEIIYDTRGVRRPVAVFARGLYATGYTTRKQALYG